MSQSQVSLTAEALPLIYTPPNDRDRRSPRITQAKDPRRVADAAKQASDIMILIVQREPGVHGAILTEALASRFEVHIEVTTFSGLRGWRPVVAELRVPLGSTRIVSRRRVVAPSAPRTPPHGCSPAASPADRSAPSNSANDCATSVSTPHNPAPPPCSKLATELPAAILARMLGIHISVAVAWQRASAGDWTTYAADVSRRALPAPL